MTKEDILHHFQDINFYYGDCMMYADLSGMLDELIAENKGEWIHILDSYYEDGSERESHWECSKCGSSRSGWGEFKFCPDCGADMRGE